MVIQTKANALVLTKPKVVSHFLSQRRRRGEEGGKWANTLVLMSLSASSKLYPIFVHSSVVLKIQMTY